MVRSTQERQHGGVAVKPAEFQMCFRDILARGAEERRVAELRERTFGPFVTISRQAGSGGGEVSRLVGARLGWPVLDRELVEDLAERLRLSPQLLALMDETKSGWFRDTILNLLNSRLLLQDSYVSMLGKVIAMAAFDGRTVIVGRGANLMLPREHGLRVRVVAPVHARVARLGERMRLSAEAAEKRIEEVDQSREEFIRRHFHTSVDDPRHYDLVIDSSVFGFDGLADVICRALEVRGLVDDAA
jgi:cytidylate kinase